MAHNYVESLQISENLCCTEKEYRTQFEQMSAVGYIAYPEEIIKVFCDKFQLAGVAGLKLKEIYHLLPSISANDLHGRQTVVLNVHCVLRIDPDPAKNINHSAPESISDNEHLLNWDGYQDNSKLNKDDLEAEEETEQELDNAIEHAETPCLECPAKWSRNVSVNRLVIESIRKRLMILTAVETRRRKGNENIKHRMEHSHVTMYCMLLNRELHVQMYYWSEGSSFKWILADKLMYRLQNVLFGKRYNF